jgi:hypothetical protein
MATAGSSRRVGYRGPEQEDLVPGRPVQRVFSAGSALYGNVAFMFNRPGARRAMQNRRFHSLRTLFWVLLAGLPLAALSGCYPYYDGHVSGYYKQGYHGSKYQSGGIYYHRDRGKRHHRYKRDRRHRYRHYHRH